MAGNVAVVGDGAQLSELGSGCSAAQVFRYAGSQCVEETELTPALQLPNTEFGGAVAISGDVVIANTAGTNCLDGPDCG